MWNCRKVEKMKYYRIKKTDFNDVSGMLPRFILEYANFELSAIYKNEYTKKYYIECFDAVHNTLNARVRGLITIDETMLNIHDVLNGVLWRDIKKGI